jgi:hypothetical protein
MVIPLIIGATRIFSKSFRKLMKTVLENREVKKLEKAAIWGTAHRKCRGKSMSTIQPTQQHMQ